MESHSDIGPRTGFWEPIATIAKRLANDKSRFRPRTGCWTEGLFSPAIVSARGAPWRHFNDMATIRPSALASRPWSMIANESDVLLVPRIHWRRCLTAKAGMAIVKQPVMHVWHCILLVAIALFAMRLPRGCPYRLAISCHGESRPP